MSAFLAAGIDNVSTLLFRYETFCDKRENSKSTNYNFGKEAYSAYLPARKISVNNAKKEKKSKRESCECV